MTIYIVFASYKGGVGRSFAAVSVSNILVRYGMRVALVDLDVDAPSLPALYGRPVFGPYGSPPGLDPPRDALPPRGLVPWVMGDNPDFEDNLLDLIPKRPAALRLLQAGPVGDGYLEQLLSPGWREDVELHPENLAGELRAAFSSLPEPPDVVIIDGRAGLVPTTGGLVRHLADRVAFLFAGDAESVEVANALIDQRGRDVVTPVLSRFPQFVDTKMRRLQSHLDDLQDGWPALFLHAAPGHEGTATPTVGLDTVDETSPLTLDHFRLAKALVPELESSPVEDPDLAAVWERSQKTLRVDYKLFRMVAEGFMENEDYQRNVAFKVETISKILDEIVESIPGRRVTDALRDAGRTAGKAFGRALADDLDETAEKHERLVVWCEFDSSTGFGAFSIERDVDYGDGWSIKLVIEDPFLNQDNRGAPLLEGYVDGVLTGLVHLSGLTFLWETDGARLTCPIPEMRVPEL